MHENPAYAFGSAESVAAVAAAVITTIPISCAWPWTLRQDLAGHARRTGGGRAPNIRQTHNLQLKRR